MPTPACVCGACRWAHDPRHDPDDQGKDEGGPHQLIQPIQDEVPCFTDRLLFGHVFNCVHHVVAPIAQRNEAHDQADRCPEAQERSRASTVAGEPDGRRNEDQRPSAEGTTPRCRLPESRIGWPPVVRLRTPQSTRVPCRSPVVRDRFPQPCRPRHRRYRQG